MYACSKGIGAFFRGDWVYSWLPADAPAVAPLHINFKEAFAIYIAARRWANHCVIIKCDNQAAIAMINKGSTPNPKVMVWPRDLFWLSAMYNFRITAVYIKDSHYIIADSLSHMHDRLSLLKLFLLLCSLCPPSNILNDSLVSHM